MRFGRFLGGVSVWTLILSLIQIRPIVFWANYNAKGKSTLMDCPKHFGFNLISLFVTLNRRLKGILWDCWKSPPSIRICSHTCWFVYGNTFLIMKLTKFQSDPSSNCFTIDVWKINCYNSLFLTFLLFFLYLILQKFCSVLTCDILGIGLL